MVTVGDLAWTAESRNVYVQTVSTSESLVAAKQNKNGKSYKIEASVEKRFGQGRVERDS
jgi:hypothetical protein